MAESHEGHDKSHTGRKTVKVRVPKFGMKSLVILMVIALVAIAAGTVLIFNPFENNGAVGVKNALSANQAGKMAVDYINNNLVASGQTATMVSVVEESGLFKVTTSYQGQNIPVYITQDGSYLFISQPLNTSQVIPKETDTTQPSTTTVPKTSKPVAQLFVMSFCPYGVQAENIMKPVFDLLGGVADIQIRFITQVGGTTVDSVQSLHGATEAQEDLRQVCIMKSYSQATYWKYLMSIDNSCYGVINTRDAAALDTCWKSAATSAGIDVARITTCSSGSEGLDLLKADEQLASQYGVSGSPTLIINGVLYSGARSSDAYKQAICGAFTTAPSQCSQTITSSNSTASATGGC